MDASWCRALYTCRSLDVAEVEAENEAKRDESEWAPAIRVFGRKKDSGHSRTQDLRLILLLASNYHCRQQSPKPTVSPTCEMLIHSAFAESGVSKMQVLEVWTGIASPTAADHYSLTPWLARCRVEKKATLKKRQNSSAPVGLSLRPIACRRNARVPDDWPEIGGLGVMGPSPPWSCSIQPSNSG